MNEWVMGVIPSYRPPHDLSDRALALLRHCDHVIVSDDASPCTSDHVLKECSSNSGVTVIRHDRNAGIARGLNDGLRAAQAAGATWLLTVDQDTDLPHDYLHMLAADAHQRQDKGVSVGAIGAQFIRDASGDMTYPLHERGSGIETEELIQTGTLWSVPALTEVGGFDESLGIDAVDAAACLRLREHHYAICVSPGTFVSHSIGSARMVRFLGREVMVTGHSPERRSTMLRNRLRLFPAEFTQSPTHAFRTLRRITTNHALGLVLENDRWEKAKGSIRGFRRGGTR